jgi:hypothetical protein
MTRADELFSRQAQWQRSRQSLSWPEKIREAERLRPSLEAFRRMRVDRADHAAGQRQGTTAPPSAGTADRQSTTDDE